MQATFIMQFLYNIQKNLTYFYDLKIKTHKPTKQGQRYETQFTYRWPNPGIHNFIAM